MVATSMTAPAAADELEDLAQLAMELAVSIMIWIHEKLTQESTCAALGILRAGGSKFSHGHNSSVLPVCLCQRERMVMVIN
jgi:non-ribosomal peptide synthetase component E (peptide arylation enzyme)